MSGTSIVPRIGLFLLAGLLLTGEAPTVAPPDLTPIQALIDSGRYAQAEAGAREVLEKLQLTGRGDSPEASRVLVLLVDALQLEGKSGSPETRSLAERAVAMGEKIWGPEHPEVAPSLLRVGIVLQNTGHPAEARPIFQRVLAILESRSEPEGSAVAQALLNLGLTFQDEGDYETAQGHYERAVSILEHSPDDSKVLLAKVLNSLGNALNEAGDLRGAIAVHERARAIREETLGPKHPDVATSLNNLATALDTLGETGRARDLYERALAIREEVLGRDHPRVATTLNNLGVLLMFLGDYETARPLYERALAIREEAFGPEHPLVAEVLGNLATLRWKTGDRQGARGLLERATSIFEKAVGVEHPNVAKCLNNQALLEEETDHFERSKSLHERALAIRLKVFGDENTEVAESLEGIASLALRAGDLAEAKKLTERVLALRRNALGADHPMVALSLRELAKIRWGSGEPGSAFDGALEAERIAREQFRATAAGLAEREALLYETIRTSGLDLAASLLTAASPSALPANSAERFVDEMFRSRSLVLDEMAARRRAVSSGEPAETARLAEALTTARERLARLVLRGPDPTRPGAYLPKVREASTAKERAERELAAKSQKFREELDRSRLGLGEIRAALPRGVTLVSYLQYGKSAPHVGKQPSVPSYLAVILRPGEKVPLVVPLGIASRIDGLVRAWKVEASSDPSGLPVPAGRESKYREAGARLRRAIWDPVASRLGRIPTVFLVPDGALNLVSFSALPASGDSYLIETGPTIHYLSAERDLTTHRRPPGNHGDLFLVGSPDFDAVPLPSSGAANSPAAVGTGSGRPPTRPLLRSSMSACGYLRSLHFDPLPGARVETEELESLWTRGAGGGTGSDARVVRLTGRQADEGSFKRMSPHHRILHLATHGFFLQGRCGSNLEEARSCARDGDGKISSFPPAGESPLLLSGLALAGANRRGENPPGASSEDGILTAEEIASLDLSGVDWVVLSACDTGVGEVRSGEGVLGLRRAFETAGAGTLILSLWPVEDRAAAEWMRRLYTARLQGLSTAEAVRRAALETLQARRERGRSTHPFYWGAFVAGGDWR